MRRTTAKPKFKTYTLLSKIMFVKYYSCKRKKYQNLYGNKTSSNHVRETKAIRLSYNAKSQLKQIRNIFENNF